MLLLIAATRQTLPKLQTIYLLVVAVVLVCLCILFTQYTAYTCDLGVRRSQVGTRSSCTKATPLGPKTRAPRLHSVRTQLIYYALSWSWTLTGSNSPPLFVPCDCPSSSAAADALSSLPELIVITSYFIFNLNSMFDVREFRARMKANEALADGGAPTHPYQQPADQQQQDSYNLGTYHQNGGHRGVKAWDV